MIKGFFLIGLLLQGLGVLASVDSVVVPIQRQHFHDRINEEQLKCDKADGKADGFVKVSANEDVNLQVTDALIRRINDVKEFIETDSALATNNQKVGQLKLVEDFLRLFRSQWASKKISPVMAPVAVDNFTQILKANIAGQSMAPFIEEVPYEIGVLNSAVFKDNAGAAQAKKLLFLKYCALHPDLILASIRPYVDEPFADSLVVVACTNNPKQLYDYASSTRTPEGKLIQRNTNTVVKTVARLSQTPNALYYYPFLDNILKGKQSIDSIKKFVGDGEKGYDSVGYYKLLVKTAIEYSGRLHINKDTPIAMFGTNGLRAMLQKKAIEHFITPINELHEQNNLNLRMKAIDPLSPQDLYYMMVMGENDIYTSSYKHSFSRLLDKLGASPRGDNLLMSVNMDYFKKFIKMAANFNQLDTFLKTMPPQNATSLMKGFVSKLDEGDNLEDAVDVADSYSSITDPKLLKTILRYVEENEQKCINENNHRGKTIYGLLRTIFLSVNDNSIDLTSQIGIPSIYSVDNNYLSDEKGRIVQQVFFYGDEDGKMFFPQFVNSFPASDWKVTIKPEWYEISSLKGKKVIVYANRPLNNDKNLDDTAQKHLNDYLFKNDIYPTVVIHRGHSYWLPRTIDRMPGSAKVILLGSCGGFKNLSDILNVCPDAHIISTKEIGKGDINRPIINYMNQTLASGKPLVWKDMWASLSKTFSSDANRSMKESWEDYIPPYRNLGAIFIKAYNKKIEGE